LLEIIMKSSAVKKHKAFQKKVKQTLADSFLKQTLGRFADDYLVSRQKVMTDNYFQSRQEAIKTIKSQSVARLDELISSFKSKAEQSGAVVFQAKDSQQVIDYIKGIIKRRNAKLIVKSKSMATEEIQLNQALETGRVEVCETDLGEWIIQLAGQRPSHMVMPAIHMTRRQVAELFSRQTGKSEPEDIPHLVQIARQKLRQKFLSADIGITGANLGIADTGALVIISNEGNARLVATLPDTHIVLMGYDKLVPSMNDAAAILDILPKNATGQPLTSYVTVLKGRNKTANKELHIILLDNGRLSLAKDTEFSEALRCIRCGACANVCPVYQAIGGHLFGHIYVGAIGIVLTAFLGLKDKSPGMDQAAEPLKSCIACGMCSQVCPAGIDIPGLIDKLRKKLFIREGTPLSQQVIFGILSQPKLFHALLRALWLGQQPVSRGQRSIRSLPLVFSDLTKNKTLPAIARHPLRDIWKSHLTTLSNPPFSPFAKGGWGDLANQNAGKETVGNKTKAAFFSGCLIDFVFPDIGQAIQKVLGQYGIEADFPLDQACCGFPAWHSGDLATARKLAEHHIRIFANPEYKYIITGCPTCALSFKRNYLELMDDPELKRQAAMVAGKTYDFSELLVKVLLKSSSICHPELVSGSNEMLKQVQHDTREPILRSRNDMISTEPINITFHDSCHMRRSLGIFREPRQLLNSAPGYKLVEMKYPDRCCGQGGSYSLKYPGISDAIMDRKLKDIIDTQADMVVTACPGCLMQIQGGLEKQGSKVVVKHIAQMLANP